MPSFSQASLRELATLHPDLRMVLREAIKRVDFSVLEGFRGEEKQNKAFDEGKSKLRWPQGRHNVWPSRAVDIAPWPIDWTDTERFVLLAGYILAVADRLGVKLRWGGDWDSDWKLKEEKFRDYGHFELA